MPSRNVLPVVAYVALLALGSVVGVRIFDHADAATGPVPGTALIRLGSTYPTASSPDRYSYVIVGRSSAAAAAALPGTSLVYHSGVHVSSSWDAGVPYSVALANGWLLTTTSGTLLKNASYSDFYIADVGSSAYQSEWARRVGDYLKSVGADGVFIDDVNANVSTLTGGVFPAKYPTQAAWEDAMASFIAAVGPALKARGLYVLVSAGKWVAGDTRNNDATFATQWWQRLGPYVSGFFNEHFLQNPNDKSYLRGDGSAWYDNWVAWSKLVEVAQGLGRDFVGMTYGSLSNTQAMRYVRATFLLYWNGGGGANAYHVDASETWSSEWTVTVGSPSAARYQVGVGWRRNYTGGTVLVNPNLTSSQTFSLGGTYLMPDGSAVTSVTLAPKTGLILRSSSATPTNTALPAVSGTPQDGVLLASTTGTWSGSPTSYAYQWNRCDTSGGACAAIAGATTSKYQLAAADVGKTIRAKVTATNSSGSTSATSLATPVVVSSPPANLTLPAISGTTEVGKTLTSSTGTWTNSPTSYQYQWQRCDSAGNGCAAIAGATASTFSLTSADVGKRLRAVVTASNSGGSATASSAASSVVTEPSPSSVSAPTSTSPPSISGTAEQGSTLTASTGSWSNSPTSYAYQWRRCDTSGGSCAAVTGATSSGYALVSGDVGHTMRVSVTASNSGGSATATSNATGVVAPTSTPLAAPPVNTSLPGISGTTEQGSTLTASTGSWSNNPTSYAYQWRRCDSGGGSCADVAGATGTQYSLTSTDVGKTLRVVVTATNSAGSASATSAASAVVAPEPVAPPAAPAAPPTNTTLPNVTGPEKIDKAAVTSQGSWDGNPTTFAYQWLRCTTDLLTSCVAIPGATLATYTFVADDKDMYVIVRVTASNAGGSTSATSKIGRPIKN